MTDTENVLVKDAHKDCGTDNTENILNRLVDSSGICKECQQNHRFTLKLDDVRTSIDVISELSQVKKILKGPVNI